MYDYKQVKVLYIKFHSKSVKFARGVVVSIFAIQSKLVNRMAWDRILSGPHFFAAIIIFLFCSYLHIFSFIQRTTQFLTSNKDI